MARKGSWVPATTVVWVGASLAGLSLVVAAAALMVEARDLPRPALQVPVAVLTGVLGVAVVFAASRAVEGPSAGARTVLVASAVVVALLPAVRYIPFVYHVTYERDLESLFPPLWPYCVALPLLILVAGELMFPVSRRARRTGVGLFLAVAAAVLLLFFGSGLLGAMGNRAAFVMVPLRVFWAHAVLEGIASALVVAALLPRWSRAWEGAALLVLGGLVLELTSTSFFAGTPGRMELGLYRWPFFPFVPVLAGTIPGVLAVLAGVVVGWSVATEEAGDDAEGLGVGDKVLASRGAGDLALLGGHVSSRGTGGAP